MTQPADSHVAQTMTARYGRPAVGRRRAGWVLVALVVAGMLGWLVWAALGRSQDSVGGLVESFDVRSPHGIAVTVRITRTSTDAVQCTITAIASDHSQVGLLTLRLPAGPAGTSTLTTLVKTEREATAADVAGCG